MYKAILYFKNCCCNRVLADKITCFFTLFMCNIENQFVIVIFSKFVDVNKL